MTTTDEEGAEVLCESFKEVFVIDNEEDVDAGMTEADTRKIPMYFERDKVKDLLLSLSLKTDYVTWTCWSTYDCPSEKFPYRCLLYSINPWTQVSYQQTGSWQSLVRFSRKGRNVMQATIDQCH